MRIELSNSRYNRLVIAWGNGLMNLIPSDNETYIDLDFERTVTTEMFRFKGSYKMADPYIAAVFELLLLTTSKLSVALDAGGIRTSDNALVI